MMRYMYKLFIQRLLSSARARNMASYCLLFPGQGSQYVGMTHKLTEAPGAQDIFRTAHSVLGYDLQELCLKGPQEQLNQTVHCQPAVVVGSLVGLGQLEQDSPEVSASHLCPHHCSPQLWP